jgi:hypothetical protein
MTAPKPTDKPAIETLRDNWLRHANHLAEILDDLPDDLEQASKLALGAMKHKANIRVAQLNYELGITPEIEADIQRVDNAMRNKPA